MGSNRSLLLAEGYRLNRASHMIGHTSRPWYAFFAHGCSHFTHCKTRDKELYEPVNEARAFPSNCLMNILLHQLSMNCMGLIILAQHPKDPPQGFGCMVQDQHAGMHPSNDEDTRQKATYHLDNDPLSC